MDLMKHTNCCWYMAISSNYSIMLHRLVVFMVVWGGFFSFFFFAVGDVV